MQSSTFPGEVLIFPQNKKKVEDDKPIQITHTCYQLTLKRQLLIHSSLGVLMPVSSWTGSQLG